MDVKEYLNRVFKLQQKLKSMRLRAEEYETLAASIPGPNYSGVRVDGTKSQEAPFVKWLEKLCDLENKIKENEEQLEKVKAEVILVIEGLDDENQKNVLMLRYISCLSWEEIMDKLFLSRTSIWRVHKCALEKITIKS